MATQTKNLNLSVFDFATDSTPDFVKGVAGLQDSNMHKIDEAIANKIKLGGEPTSINLVEENGMINKINNHSVLMRTDLIKTPIGVTDEERHIEILKTLSQEFISDGSDIVVDGGIDKQRVVSTKIEGQTIKCYATNTETITMSLNVNRTHLLKQMPLEKGKTYNCRINCSSLEGTCNLYLLSDEGFLNSTNIILKEGVSQFNLTIKSSINETLPYKLYFQSGDGSVTIEEFCITDIMVNEHIPYGLNSTKATITNNGEKYCFCANEGEIIKLNKIGNIADTLEILEDGSGVLTQKTYYNNLENLINKISFYADTSEDYRGIYFIVPQGSMKTGLSTITLVEKDIAPGGVFNCSEKVMYIHSNSIKISIPKNELVSNNKEGIIDWIYRNKIEFVKTILTPIVTHIPKELIPTIATYKTNKFTFGEEVKPSTAIINMPISKIEDLETRLSQLEKVVSSTSNLSLLSNYVEDEYNKEIDQL